MLKDIQDWFPLKSYHGRISALLLLILSLLGYYLWLLPFLINFNEGYYYFKVHERASDYNNKTSIEITAPRYFYGSETRKMSVEIRNQTSETIKNLSLQVLLDNASSRRISIKSNSLITFENIQPDIPVSGEIPLSITGLDNGDEVELNFLVLYSDGSEVQKIIPQILVGIELDRWKGLSNLIIENMLFPNFSLVLIFAVVVISCSLFEGKDDEKQPILSKSGILQIAKLLFSSSGAILLIFGIMIGLVTQWHLNSLAMMFSGILLTIMSPKTPIKKNEVRTAKIIVSASGDEKEVVIKE